VVLAKESIKGSGEEERRGDHLEKHKKKIKKKIHHP
jgi:hypothetical protein